jgi:crotonobetainyl-CoA:carnitine CoA-transferase CaiB-like acyl-CoA transferase
VDALIPQLREVFLTQPTDAWLARLHAADLIAERILNPGEWLRNAHVEATRAAVCQQTPGVGASVLTADAGHCELFGG